METGSSHTFVITNVSQKFRNILLYISLLPVYHVTEAVQAVVLTCCSFYYRDSSCADMLCIASHRLIREVMLHGFELSHNAAEDTKNIFIWKVKVHSITVQ